MEPPGSSWIFLRESDCHDVPYDIRLVLVFEFLENDLKKCPCEVVHAIAFMCRRQRCQLILPNVVIIQL